MAQPIGQPEPAPASSDSAIVYYDGWCNACIKAANMFTKLDKDRQLVQCVDFRKTDDPRLDLIDRDQSELASTLHVRSLDGSITSGPEAIRSVFTILGKHRQAAWTGLPIIRPIVDWCYRIFARNRLRWFRNHQCESGSCAINPQENSPP